MAQNSTRINFVYVLLLLREPLSLATISQSGMEVRDADFQLIALVVAY